MSRTLGSYLLTSMVLDHGVYAFKPVYTVFRLGYVSPFDAGELRKCLDAFLAKVKDPLPALVAPEYCLPLTTLRFLFHGPDFRVKFDGVRLLVLTAAGNTHTVSKVKVHQLRSFSRLFFKTEEEVFTLQAEYLPAAEFKLGTASVIEVFAPILNPLYKSIAMAEEEQRAIPIGGYYGKDRGNDEKTEDHNEGISRDPAGASY